MKYKLSQLSQSLFLGGSIIVSGMSSALANVELNNQDIAMSQDVSTFAADFSRAKFSSNKLLEMADNIHTTEMTSSQEKLVFALVYSAAKRGLAEAQFRLANYYIDSDLVVADETEAAFWLEEAIEQGHKGAKFVYENIYVLSFDIGC